MMPMKVARTAIIRPRDLSTAWYLAVPLNRIISITKQAPYKPISLGITAKIPRFSADIKLAKLSKLSASNVL